MRATVALLIPLLLVLGAIAWGATLVVEHTGRRWFDRDTRLRAQLAVSGARESLEGPVRSGDKVRVRRVLASLARDERVMGAAVCGPRDAAVVATPQFPEDLGCEQVRDRGPLADPPGEPWDFEARRADGRVHVTAVP